MTPEKAQNKLAREGRCGGEGELFFSTERKDWAEAKTLCRKCPVQDVCLGYALDQSEVFGVWGGADQRELREALGLDANGEPYSWSSLRCPSCRTAQPDDARNIENATGSTRRGWVYVQRTCPECYLEWTRQEPRKLNRRKKAKK